MHARHHPGLGNINAPHVKHRPYGKPRDNQTSRPLGKVLIGSNGMGVGYLHPNFVGLGGRRQLRYGNFLDLCLVDGTAFVATMESPFD